MRNVLVFPDGSEHDFMYPNNREVVVGTEFRAELEDKQSAVFVVSHIQKTDKEVYYHLKRL